MEYLNLLIGLICVAWILFSTFLVVILCMNSSRLSRMEEPFKDPSAFAKERREKRERMRKG